MHIAYSALRNINEDTNPIITDEQPLIMYDDERMHGYLAACTRYRHEIAAIQQYIPGWVPKPPTSLLEEL